MSVSDTTKALGLQGLMQKSLTDLVRGIRSHKKDESAYIASCIQEIKEELKSTNMNMKATAVQKITYLKMLGFDVSWAAFPVVEIMSAAKFTTKRVGYLAASQFFNETTALAIMTTNLIRKDMTTGANQYEAAAALNCLACICTPDLARDLAADVVALLNTSRSYVRKRAVLVLFKIFLKFPDALRPAFPRLREKLEDQDMPTVAAAVNVIAELARKNPANYLSLAPVLYKLLTSGQCNNWMLIKIIKLFGALTPLEKRLGKKLAEPLTNLINTTTAMSVLYEVIQTCAVGMADNQPLIRLCLTRLRSFVEDPDQNLKYLGLVALSEIMQTHPKAVTEHRDLVLWCLDDEDQTIRSRALTLLTGMVSKKNIAEIVAKLMAHVAKAEGAYRDELVEKIVAICSGNQYAHMSDFEWYLQVLLDLAHVPGTQHGALLAAQLLDVLIRVKPLRDVGVKAVAALLSDVALLHDSPGKDTRYEVLYAAAWAVGEYAELVEEPSSVLAALLQPRALALPAHIQAVYLHNALKLVAVHAHKAPDQLPILLAALSAGATPFAASVHLEVQERACFALQVAALLGQAPADSAAALLTDLTALFAEPLNPVAPGSQKKVAVPDELALDAELHPDAFAEEADLAVDDPIWHPEQPAAPPAASPAARTQRSGEYILKGEVVSLRAQLDRETDLPPLRALPAGELPPLGVQAAGGKKGKAKAKPRIGAAAIDLTTDAPPEAPAPAAKKAAAAAASRALDPLAAVDLTTELKPGEALFVRSHHVVKAPAKEPEPKKPKKKAAAAAAALPVAAEAEARPKKGKKAAAKKAAAAKPKAAAAAAPATAAPAAAATAPAAGVKVPAGGDAVVSVEAEVKLSNEAHKALVELSFRASQPLSAVALALAPPPGLRIARQQVAEAVAAGAPSTAYVLLEFDSFVPLAALPATLAYTAAGEARRVELSVPLPNSAFLVPTKLTREQFAAVLAKEAKALAPASATFAAKDQRAALMAIASALHLALVEVVPGAASLYARSVQGHHVLALVKMQAPDAVRVDLKASDAALAANLIAEAAQLFQRK